MRCPECGEFAEHDCCGPCGVSRCHDCGEWRADPSEFYDGLRCTVCCEEADDADV